MVPDRTEFYQVSEDKIIVQVLKNMLFQTLRVILPPLGMIPKLVNHPYRTIIFYVSGDHTFLMGYFYNYLTSELSEPIDLEGFNPVRLKVYLKDLRTVKIT